MKPWDVVRTVSHSSGIAVRNAHDRAGYLLSWQACSESRAGRVAGVGARYE